MYNRLRLICKKLDKGGKAMKKYIVSIIAIMLLILIISCSVCKVQALGLDAFTNPEDYTSNVGDNTKILGFGNIIVWVVRTVGTAISVLMLVIIGIKYIMGSVEEKAEYKQTMWPYIIGAILIFAGASITNMIYEMMNK